MFTSYSSTLVRRALLFLPLYASSTHLTALVYAAANLQISQNVTSSSTAVAALEAARDAKAPIILQMSQGGAAFFAGKVRRISLALGLEEMGRLSLMVWIYTGFKQH
jgi:hypothetical protein